MFLRVDGSLWLFGNTVPSVILVMVGASALYRADFAMMDQHRGFIGRCAANSVASLQRNSREAPFN